MSDFERTLIAVGFGCLVGQLLIIIYYVALADRLDRRRRMGPPRGRYGSPRLELPLAANLIRYSRWQSEQIERALRDDTGTITFPDPDPSRRPTNPFTGEPVQPKSQFPPPRIIRDDFLP